MSDDAVAEVLRIMRSLQHDFANHANKLLEVEGKIDNLLAAMPETGGGLSGHKRWHELQIESEKTRGELKRDVMSGVMKWGAIGTIGLFLLAISDGIKIKLRLWLGL